MPTDKSYSNPEYQAKRARHRVYERKWRETHPEQLREKYLRRYQQTLEANKRSWLRYPERQKARVALGYEVKVGRVVKPLACEQCHEVKPLQGHHHLGYAEEHWFHVIWLCRRCHYALHRL